MKKYRFGWYLSVAVMVACLPYSLTAQTKTEKPTAKPVVNSSLGQTKNVHRCGSLFFSGQFSSGDVSIIKQAGVQRVISLRTKGEIEWDEAAVLKDAGLEFVVVPFLAPESLTDEVFDKVRKLLKDQEKTPGSIVERQTGWEGFG